MKRHVKSMLVLCSILVCCCFGTQQVHAEEVKYTQVENYKDSNYKESLKEYAPVIKGSDMDFSLNSKGKTKLQWENTYYNTDAKITYEIQVADNAKFKKAKKFTTKKTTLSISKSNFGKNGGTIYMRVRFYDTWTGKKVYSSWSETKELNFVKINKKNFPGMYKLLKNGGRNWNFMTGEITTEIYDSNKDGWLDPKEIYALTSLHNRGHVANKPLTQVSSFAGVEYLKNLQHIYLDQYSGTKVDLSENESIDTVDVRGITKSSIKVIAPDASDIYIEGSALQKVDLSKCKAATYVYVWSDGRNISTLKLPSEKKNLREIRLKGYNAATLNLNTYKNLQEVICTYSNFSQLSMNKCTNLKFLTIGWCDNVSNVDLGANKKIKAVCVKRCANLTTSKVAVGNPSCEFYTQDVGYSYAKSYEKYNKEESNYRSRSAININAHFTDAEINSKGKIKLTWSVPLLELVNKDGAKIRYQVQVADNIKFKNAKSFTSKKMSVTFSKSKLGKNGGIFYFRVRLYDTLDGKKVYSPWSETKQYTFVKINKTNFPGMYTLIKNGGDERTSEGVIKQVYDTDGDGWLEPKEIEEIWTISTIASYYDAKTGGFKEKSVTNVSSLKGIEYFTKLQNLELSSYSGTELDASKSTVERIEISGISSNKIKICAPKATSVYLKTAENNTKLEEIDVSECNQATAISITGNEGTKLIKLPKNKWRLTNLALKGFRFKETQDADLKCYKKLKYLYLE